jgi:hypothetical protein
MYIRLTPVRVWILVALAVAAGAWFVVDRLVVTDRERVVMAMNSLEDGVEKNDVAAVMACLDPSVRIAGMDREEFASWYARALSLWQVKSIVQFDRNVKLDAHDPDMAVATVGTYIAMKEPPQEMRIDWRLEFRRRGPKEWKLSSARAYMLNNEVPLGAYGQGLH